MSRHLTLMLSAVLICGLAAQTAMAGSPADAIARFDKDNDKTLDLAEVKAAAGAEFAKLEKDADSTIDAKEAKGVVTPAEFKAADPDDDGTLSKDEYVALAEKFFKEADTDHDGTLDGKELGSKTGLKLLKLIGG